MIWQAGRGWRIGVSLSVAALLVLAAAPAALGADRVYWANGNHTISYANLDGSGGGGQLNLSGATPNGVRGVAIDHAAGRIHWANQGNDTISYANLDGSGGGGQLNTTGAVVIKPHGVTIDPATRRIYWANDANNPISYANLDGSGGGPLNTTGAALAGPYGIAIDPAAGKIYWANRDTDTISYANLDGSGGGGELNISGTTTDKPHGVTIDPVARKAYWANLGGTISYANLDGSGGGGELNLSGGGPGGPVGMAIDPTAGWIYWANLGNDKISFVNLDGSGVGGQVNISGATSSDPRFLTLLRAPSGTGAPAISGESAIGSVLSCSQGSWAPDLPGAFLYRAPQAFAYQWSRDGVDISGATTSLYTVFATGEYRCRVTASDKAGDTSQTSAPLTVTAAGGGGTSVGVTGAGGTSGVGTGGGGTAGGAGATTFPPAPASFAGSRSVIATNRGGGFPFSFHATRTLSGRATFDSVGRIRVSRKSNGWKRVTLARMSFTVLPGGKVRLWVRLSRANFRILTLNRRISTRITVVLKNAAGLTRTSSQTITLKAPQPLQR